MELGFRKRLREMRGKKRQEQFAEEIGMSRSNYSLIEAGKSNPTIKTLEQIAKATNSTLVVDLIPNESEQLELETEDKQQ
ncbi:MAG: helix-turn-helix transcriptional regulator [Enterococcus faecalis]|nr:helix-turn-helix transcriptional regulator [Enterococcus faecalis]